MAYADHNGQPFVSIGKWLVDKGELPLAQASMQGIREWAKRNPKRVSEMLNVNPALVFFKEEPITDPEQGPKGAYGVPLMAQRSIAVDTNFVPLGTPVFLATTQPASTQTMNRLVFAQDTGIAIKGACVIASGSTFTERGVGSACKLPSTNARLYCAKVSTNA